MILQSLKAAVKAVVSGKPVVIGLWPSTPRGPRDIVVGDDVLLRVSATQDRGVPAKVTALVNGAYTVRWLNGTFTGVLKGCLQLYKLEEGAEVECVHGAGRLTKIGEDECEVEVGGTLHKIERLAVLPATEPHSGFDKNATIELMRRKCGITLVHLDFLPGPSREGARERVHVALIHELILNTKHFRILTACNVSRDDQ